MYLTKFDHVPIKHLITTRCSVFPSESEYVYPPCTFIKPLYAQRLRGLDEGLAVTVRPSFPS